MDAPDPDPRHTAAALRALLERAADQAAKLSTILGKALESDAFNPTTAAPGPDGPPQPYPPLTPRESDVLDLILEGLSSKEIARELGISRATARCHIQNILTKLGVYSRRQAAAIAASPPAGPAAPSNRAAVLPELATLTPRETEVLRALAAGMEQREIAERFVVSPHTVRTHVQRVLAKLGVHSVLGAMAVARTAGLPPLR